MGSDWEELGPEFDARIDIGTGERRCSGGSGSGGSASSVVAVGAPADGDEGGVVTRGDRNSRRILRAPPRRGNDAGSAIADDTMISPNGEFGQSTSWTFRLLRSES